MTACMAAGSCDELLASVLVLIGVLFGVGWLAWLLFDAVVTRWWPEQLGAEEREPERWD